MNPSVKCNRMPVVALAILLLAIVSEAQNASQFDAAAEAQIFAALNQSRVEAGVPPLKSDPKLQEAARRHSLLLAKRHALSHQFAGEAPLADRFRAVGLLFTAAAENVGMNTELSDVNNMFLRSPGHRANMLNAAYDAGGVGVVRLGSSYWVTEDFAKLTPELSVDKAEDQAAAAFEARWKQDYPSTIKRVAIANFRAFACKTARAGGKLQGASVTYDNKPARQLFAYSTAEPSSLPPQVDANLGGVQATTYAVAACTPQEWGSDGQFWMVLALF
jgi:hypothetical protein